VGCMLVSSSCTKWEWRQDQVECQGQKGGSGKKYTTHQWQAVVLSGHM
jgi:hypothetical protein